MNNDAILSQIIDKAEQLKRLIQNDCQVPANCLGEQMLSAYKTVRKYHLTETKKILNQLREL